MVGLRSTIRDQAIVCCANCTGVLELLLYLFQILLGPGAAGGGPGAGPPMGLPRR